MPSDKGKDKKSFFASHSYLLYLYILHIYLFIKVDLFFLILIGKWNLFDTLYMHIKDMQWVVVAKVENGKYRNHKDIKRKINKSLRTKYRTKSTSAMFQKITPNSTSFI